MRDDREVVLPGRVASGIGGHAHWMTVHSDLYAAKVGMELFPGTLNVVLNEPWYAPAHCIRMEPPEYAVPLSIVPCRISGLAAFILRTDKNNAGQGDHAPTVIELAAPVRLRDALNLNDGDEVNITLDDAVTG
jgi:CTP-dependent riboflavin kinase